MHDNAQANRSDSSILKQLTAYLDGELPAEEIREVEARLAEEEKYRQLMQQLQKAWDALDVLPVAAANQSFTQSTMKMVVEDAEKLSRLHSRSARTWPIRMLALILAPAIALVGGWAAARLVQNQRNSELVRELPVLYQLDALNCDERLSIPFLERLSREGDIFENARLTQAPIRPVNLSLPHEHTMAWIGDLPDQEKTRLSINREKFGNLDKASRNRIKQLQSDLAQHPDSRNLTSILWQYQAWLKTLGESDRASYLDLEKPETRIARIKQINREQYYANFGKAGLTALPVDDADTIYLGFLWLIQTRENEIRDALTPSEDMLVQAEANARLAAGEIKENQWSTYLGGERLDVINRYHPEKINEIIAGDTIETLRFLMSRSVRQQINAAVNWQGNPGKSEADLLATWMLNTFNARFNTVGPSSLRDFYHTLKSDEKDRVDNEHPADRNRVLRQLYRQRYPR